MHYYWFNYCFICIHNANIIVLIIVLEIHVHQIVLQLLIVRIELTFLSNLRR